MKFKYFLEPEKYSIILDNEHECDICHKITKCFDGSWFYGGGEYVAFCFDCVSKGRLEEVKAFGADPDVTELRKQISELNPSISNEELEKQVQIKNKELEYTTPRLLTWQDFSWPAHCGEYCQFIKFAGQTELNELASNGNGKEFFKQNLYGVWNKNNTDVDSVWADLKEAPIEEDETWSPMVYVFRCIKCEEYFTSWDCD